MEGHSRAAEQLALKARDAGFDVVYEGSRATADQMVVSAVEEGVHAIGLATQGGDAAPLRRVTERAAAAGLSVPILATGEGSELAVVIGDLLRLVSQPANG